MFKATKSLNSSKDVQMSPEGFGAINAYLLGHGAHTLHLNTLTEREDEWRRYICIMFTVDQSVSLPQSLIR